MRLLKFNFRWVHVLIVMLVQCATVLAQNEFPPKAKWDTAYINKMLLACDSLRFTDVNRAEKIALKCLKEAQQLSYKQGVAASYITCAEIEFNSMKFNKAIFFYKKALPLSVQFAPKYLFKIYPNLASAYNQLVMYDSAIYYCNKALVYEKKHPSSKIKVAIYSLLIQMYAMQNNYKNIDNLAILAIDEYNKDNKDSNFPMLFTAIGAFYTQTNTNKALYYYNKAIHISLLLND
ncbi:MAG: hypothetical protein ABL940_09095, partial [Bacteroidia bacterium]